MERLGVYQRSSFPRKHYGLDYLPHYSKHSLSGSGNYSHEYLTAIGPQVELYRHLHDRTTR